MNTNIIITLDKRRAKKDGTYPLIFRLSHLRKTIPISTGISVKDKDWDDKSREIKKSYDGVSSVARLNNQLQKKKSLAFDKINELEELGTLESYSIKQLKVYITGEKNNSDFFSYAQTLISRLLEANRFGNASIYKTVVNVLKTFHKAKKLDLKQINYDFLKRFETFHLSKGNSINSLSVYLRTIRAIFNQAVSAGIIDKKYYPFDSYSIRQTKTQKRAISNEELKRVIALQLDESHACFNARNYFIISYMLYGINFIDMAFLRTSNIIDGRINYIRRKTGKEYSIKISPQLNVLLDHYLSINRDNEFIFPIVKRTNQLEQFKDVKWARSRYNKRLKEIAKLCGIELNLTSYVSRHSFATQAMLKNVPLNAISEMMGHSRLNTTQVYLKSLPNVTLDNYNDDIVNL